MELQGLDRLSAHLPDLRSPGRRLAMVLMGFACFAAATAAMLAVDLYYPAWTLAGQLGVILVAVLLFSQFFVQRSPLQARYGNLAYRHAFVAFVLTALPMIWAAIFHTAYLPGERAVADWAAPVALIIGAYLSATAILLFARTVFAFGADNLAMLYVYYPAEGRVVKSSIYSLIRHPLYSAVVHLGLALGLWRGTWSSVAFGLFMPLGLMVYLRCLEEADLIKRFGEGYARYRTEVPAFVPLWRDVGRFWNFLVTGK